MSKLIPIICKELNLEINEEFKVKGINNSMFKFTEFELLQKTFNKEWYQSSLPLNLLLNSVIKLPFEPKYGDKYCSYVTPKFNIVESIWTNCVHDFALLKCGCVFRTKAEAIKARPQKYKELTGKEYKE